MGVGGEATGGADSGDSDAVEVGGRAAALGAALEPRNGTSEGSGGCCQRVPGGPGEGLFGAEFELSRRLRTFRDAE